MALIQKKTKVSRNLALKGCEISKMTKQKEESGQWEGGGREKGRGQGNGIGPENG